jgi:hypothetical protein
MVEVGGLSYLPARQQAAVVTKALGGFGWVEPVSVLDSGKVRPAANVTADVDIKVENPRMARFGQSSG